MSAMGRGMKKNFQNVRFVLLYNVNYDQLSLKTKYQCLKWRIEISEQSQNDVSKWRSVSETGYRIKVFLFSKFLSGDDF